MKIETKPATANSPAPKMTTRMRASARRAASRAPVSEPIASTELSIPNPSAPCPKSIAIVEAMIGKFMPNRASRNTMPNSTSRARRFAT